MRNADLSLKGMSAVVTGGAKGIGAAITRTLAENGARVAVLDRDPEPDGGAFEVFHQCDVSDYDAVSTAINSVNSEFGRLDLIVNNAGWDKVEPFLKNDAAFWAKLVQINLIGVFNVTHSALPLLAENGGRIINIASDAGRVGSSGEAAYSACKGGVIAFTKAIAREGARQNILVNCVCPGPTATPLLDEIRSNEKADRIIESVIRATPLRKLATPEDVAAAVLYFAGEPGHVTGQVLSVSGGLTMAG